MKYTITLHDLTAAQVALAMAAVAEGKTASVTAEPKTAAKGKGKKAPPVEVEEDVVEDEQEEFGSDEEEVTEDEPDFDADAEEDVTEDEEVEEAPKKKAAAKAAPGKATAPKITLEQVIAEFQATHKKLEKKLKSKEKTSAKLNSLLKKHGAKSTRTLDAKLYSAVMKDLKALVA